MKLLFVWTGRTWTRCLSMRFKMQRRGLLWYDEMFLSCRIDIVPPTHTHYGVAGGHADPHSNTDPSSSSRLAGMPSALNNPPQAPCQRICFVFSSPPPSLSARPSLSPVGTNRSELSGFVSVMFHGLLSCCSAAASVCEQVGKPQIE